MARLIFFATANSFRNQRDGKRRSSAVRVSPHGSIPTGPRTFAPTHFESSKPTLFQPFANDLETFQPSSVLMTSGSPVVNSTVSEPTTPAGFSFVPSLRPTSPNTYVLPDSMRVVRSFHFTVLKLFRAPRSNSLSQPRHSLSPVYWNNARLILRFAGMVISLRNQFVSTGAAFAGSPSGNQIQLVSAKTFVTSCSSRPIHLAAPELSGKGGLPRHSVGERTPMLHFAGLLHAETVFSSDHTRTFQKHSACEPSVLPAYGTRTDCDDSTLPLSQRSARPVPSFASLDAMRT